MFKRTPYLVYNTWYLVPGTPSVPVERYLGHCCSWSIYRYCPSFIRRLMVSHQCTNRWEPNLTTGSIHFLHRVSCVNCSKHCYTLHTGTGSHIHVRGQTVVHSTPTVRCSTGSIVSVPGSRYLGTRYLVPSRDPWLPVPDWWYGNSHSSYCLAIPRVLLIQSKYEMQCNK